MDVNSSPSSYPLLTVLSTSHNGTYISTSSNGAQDQPCPSSYTYNSNIADPDEDPFSGGCCTFNASYACHGYYDLSTSRPIYFETSTNFTGSPEDVTTTAELQAADAKYGVTYLSLILPETYATSSSSNYIGTNIGHYEAGNHIFGFVDTHEEQVLGLGLNSTFLNALYAKGMIASRSIGLYYGVPAAAGADLERNGSMIMGGYSTSRLQGNLSSHTYLIGAWKLSRHCPWEIDISEISTGTKVATTEFTACIEPSELSLVLPSSIYNQLSSSSNSSDLTITLSNGLSATIPSSLISMRAVTDADQSPILGAPFLSQFYIYADYQEKTLSVGLANNTVGIGTTDKLQCVEHANSTGDLGWAVGNPTDLLSTGTGTSTASGAGATSTRKSSGAGRLEEGLGMLRMGLVGLGVWVGLYISSVLTTIHGGRELGIL
jgi:hypothetical protein